MFANVDTNDKLSTPKVEEIGSKNQFDNVPSWAYPEFGKAHNYVGIRKKIHTGYESRIWNVLRQIMTEGNIT